MKNFNAASNAELDDAVIASDAQQGQRMLRSVYDFTGQFVAYPSEHAHVAHVLWIVHAHMMDRWDSTPRLAALSAEPASGKSRLLEVTELLVPNPVAAVNVSPAYLFRKVGAEEGATILFDEIDTVFGPKAKENEEIRGLLNAGHRRSGVAGRCVVKGKEIVTEEIPAYAAVALAGLGWLPDTILSRSIIIRMRRRHQGERVEPFRRRIHAVEGVRVRTLIEVWTQAQPQEVTWAELPPEIQDRDADVWEPLLTVAEAAGGDWPARARAAALALVADSKEAEPSLGVRLLADLRTVFGDKDEMTSKAILSALCALEEAPWGDLKGKPLDERGLARRLRQYGVKSKTVRFSPDERDTAKGYSRDDLHDAWSRYLPQPHATSVTSVTSVTSATVLPFQAPVAGDVATAAPEEPSPLNGVTDVTDVTDLSGHRGGKRTCEQCRGPDDGKLQLCLPTRPGADRNMVWLHKECVPFFERARYRVKAV